MISATEKYILSILSELGILSIKSSAVILIYISRDDAYHITLLPPACTFSQDIITVAMSTLSCQYQVRVLQGHIRSPLTDIRRHISTPRSDIIIPFLSAGQATDQLYMGVGYT